MSARSLSYVREQYGVPVKRGQRVLRDGREWGVVTCGDGAHVRVRFDGQRHSVPCHPLSLDYGDGVSPADRLAYRNARINTWNDRLNGRITAEEYRERMALPLTPSPGGGECRSPQAVVGPPVVTPKEARER